MGTDTTYTDKMRTAIQYLGSIEAWANHGLTKEVTKPLSNLIINTVFKLC